MSSPARPGLIHSRSSPFATTYKQGLVEDFRRTARIQSHKKARQDKHALRRQAHHQSSSPSRSCRDDVYDEQFMDRIMFNDMEKEKTSFMRRAEQGGVLLSVDEAVSLQETEQSSLDYWSEIAIPSITCPLDSAPIKASVRLDGAAVLSCKTCDYVLPVSTDIIDEALQDWTLHCFDSVGHEAPTITMQTLEEYSTSVLTCVECDWHYFV